MAYIVRSKKSKDFLTSPDILTTSRGHVDALWFWSSNQNDAHHFADRAEAKATLRQIDRRPGANLVAACTFFKV